MAACAKAKVLKQLDHSQLTVDCSMEDDMAKYMYTGSYTEQGAKGLLKEGGTARRAVVEKMLASVGGKLESMYFCMGKDDFIVIMDMPDHLAGAAISLTVGASGAVRGQTTVLMTPEEVDKVVKKTLAYRAPGA